MHVIIIVHACTLSRTIRVFLISGPCHLTYCYHWPPSTGTTLGFRLAPVLDIELHGLSHAESAKNNCANAVELRDLSLAESVTIITALGSPDGDISSVQGCARLPHKKNLERNSPGALYLPFTCPIRTLGGRGVCDPTFNEIHMKSNEKQQVSNAFVRLSLI